MPIPAQRPFLAVLPASSPLRLPQPSLSPCISTQLPGRSISMAAAAHSQQAVSTLEQEAPGMAAQHGPGAAPGSSNPRPYPPKDLDHTSAPSFLDNIDCILFDCDGGSGWGSLVQCMHAEELVQFSSGGPHGPCFWHRVWKAPSTCFLHTFPASGVLWTGSHQVPGAAEVRGAFAMKINALVGEFKWQARACVAVPHTASYIDNTSPHRLQHISSFHHLCACLLWAIRRRCVC